MSGSQLAEVLSHFAQKHIELSNADKMLLEQVEQKLIESDLMKKLVSSYLTSSHPKTRWILGCAVNDSLGWSADAKEWLK